MNNLQELVKKLEALKKQAKGYADWGDGPQIMHQYGKIEAYNEILNLMKEVK